MRPRPTLRSALPAALGLLMLTAGGREPARPLTLALAGDVSVGRAVAHMDAAGWGKPLQASGAR